MSLTGSADPMQDAALHVYVTHENLSSTNKSLVVFQDGGHAMFLNDCNSATGMADVAFEWCADSVWDTNRVHDLTNHFAAAFLKAELYGDDEAAKALAPEMYPSPASSMRRPHSAQESSWCLEIAQSEALAFHLNMHTYGGIQPDRRRGRHDAVDGVEHTCYAAGRRSSDRQAHLGDRDQCRPHPGRQDRRDWTNWNILGVLQQISALPAA